jgi:O-antigen ligase
VDADVVMSRSVDGVRGAALIALGCLAAFVAAARAAGGDFRLAFLVVAACSAALLALSPKFGALLILVLGVTVLPDPLRVIELGGFRSDPLELAVLGFLGVWLVWSLAGRATSSVFGVPLGIIVLAAGVGVVVSLSAGGTRALVLYPLKVFLFYLLPLALLTFFPARADRRQLERWLYWTTTSACLYVIAALLSRGVLPIAAVTDQVTTLGVVESVQRVRPAVLAPLLLVTLLLMARTYQEGLSLGRVVQGSIYVMVLALSFNRSTWVPMLVASALYVAIRPGHRRPLSGLRVVVAAGLLVVIVAGIGDRGPFDETRETIVGRVVSTVNPDVLRESSYRDRASENAVALATIAEHPIFGVGLGQPYGARRPQYFPDPPRVVFTDRLFIHNGFLGVWLQLGLLGLLGFGVLAVTVVRLTGLARAGRARSSPRQVAAGVALLAYGLQALLAIAINIRPNIIAVSFALVLLAPSVDEYEDPSLEDAAPARRDGLVPA